jgi:xanthine dehydrogenase accessory factor
MIVWPEIARLIDTHGAAALVTLAEAAGSSPREPGARMVVAPDGRFSGTIGGGALEWGALAEAQALLVDRDGPAVRRLDRALGPDLGQCCGGRVTLLIERFGSEDRAAVEQLAAAEGSGEVVTRATPDAKGRLRRRIATADASRLASDELCRRLDDGTLLERFGDPRTPLYLFGAGHVGTALAAALGPLPFSVTWIDPRAGAFPDHVAPNIRCVTDNDPVRFIADAPAGAFIAVMTHSHALDLDLVIAALQAERFPYVGLIGSDTKRARFVSAMRKIGVPGIERLVCPIGLPGIRDKAPAAIAAAVAAQLLIVREAQTEAASDAPHRHEGEHRGGRRA